MKGSISADIHVGENTGLAVTWWNETGAERTPCDWRATLSVTAEDGILRLATLYLDPDDLSRLLDVLRTAQDEYDSIQARERIRESPAVPVGTS